MIRRARTQAVNVGSDRQGHIPSRVAETLATFVAGLVVTTRLTRLPTLSLRSGGVPVAGGGAPLEIDSGGRPTRID